MKKMRRSPDERLRTAADCLSRLRGLSPDPMSIPREKHSIGTNPNLLFEDGPGPGLEPVGGEFQPSFETGYAGGDAHLIFVLNQLCQLSPVAAGLGQFCQLRI
jgi:hypothetical protein